MEEVTTDTKEAGLRRSSFAGMFPFLQKQSSTDTDQTDRARKPAGGKGKHAPFGKQLYKQHSGVVSVPDSPQAAAAEAIPTAVWSAQGRDAALNQSWPGPSPALQTTPTKGLFSKLLSKKFKGVAVPRSPSLGASSTGSQSPSSHSEQLPAAASGQTIATPPSRGRFAAGESSMEDEGQYDSYHSTPVGSEVIQSPNVGYQEEYGGDTLDLRQVLYNGDGNAGLMRQDLPDVFTPGFNKLLQQAGGGSPGEFDSKRGPADLQEPTIALLTGAQLSQAGCMYDVPAMLLGTVKEGDGGSAARLSADIATAAAATVQSSSNSSKQESPKPATGPQHGFPAATSSPDLSVDGSSPASRSDMQAAPVSTDDVQFELADVTHVLVADSAVGLGKSIPAVTVEQALSAEYSQDAPVAGANSATANDSDNSMQVTVGAANNAAKGVIRVGTASAEDTSDKAQQQEARDLAVEVNSDSADTSGAAGQQWLQECVGQTEQVLNEPPAAEGMQDVTAMPESEQQPAVDAGPLQQETAESAAMADAAEPVVAEWPAISNAQPQVARAAATATAAAAAGMFSSADVGEGTELADSEVTTCGNGIAAIDESVAGQQDNGRDSAVAVEGSTSAVAVAAVATAGFISADLNDVTTLPAEAEVATYSGGAALVNQDSIAAQQDTERDSIGAVKGSISGAAAEDVDALPVSQLSLEANTAVADSAPLKTNNTSPHPADTDAACEVQCPGAVAGDILVERPDAADICEAAPAVQDRIAQDSSTLQEALAQNHQDADTATLQPNGDPALVEPAETMEEENVVRARDPAEGDALAASATAAADRPASSVGSLGDFEQQELLAREGNGGSAANANDNMCAARAAVQETADEAITAGSAASADDSLDDFEQQELLAMEGSAGSMPMPEAVDEPVLAPNFAEEPLADVSSSQVGSMPSVPPSDGCYSAVQSTMPDLVSHAASRHKRSPMAPMALVRESIPLFVADPSRTLQANEESLEDQDMQQLAVPSFRGAAHASAASSNSQSRFSAFGGPQHVATGQHSSFISSLQPVREASFSSSDSPIPEGSPHLDSESSGTSLTSGSRFGAAAAGGTGDLSPLKPRQFASPMTFPAAANLATQAAGGYGTTGAAASPKLGMTPGSVHSTPTMAIGRTAGSGFLQGLTTPQSALSSVSVGSAIRHIGGSPAGRMAGVSPAMPGMPNVSPTLMLMPNMGSQRAGATPVNMQAGGSDGTTPSLLDQQAASPSAVYASRFMATPFRSALAALPVDAALIAPLVDSNPFSLRDDSDGMDTVCLADEAQRVAANLAAAAGGFSPATAVTPASRAAATSGSAAGATSAVPPGPGSPTEELRDLHVVMLTKQLAEVQKRLKDVEGENVQLRERVEIYEFEKDELNSQEEMEKQARQYAEDQLQQLQVEMQQLMQANSMQAQQLQAMQVGIELVQAQAQQERDAVMQENAELRSYIQQLQVERNQVSDRVNMLDMQMTAMRSNIADLNATLAAEQQRCAEMEALVAARDRDLAEAGRAQLEAQAKLEKAMEQMIAAGTAKEHARQKAAQEAAKVHQLAADKQQLLAECEKRMQDHHHLKQKYAHKSAALKAAEQQFHSKELENQELMAMCDQLLQQQEAGRQQQNAP